MTSPGIDVVAVGDAIVDVIATCDDRFIEERGLVKGSMQLLTTAQADELYAAMGPAREISGGSAANSMAGIAALGLDVAFIGQVAADQLETALKQYYVHQMPLLMRAGDQRVAITVRDDQGAVASVISRVFRIGDGSSSG